MYMGGIHGYDVITSQLITGYGSDSEVTRLMDSYDWWFVPVFNPDGYAYSWVCMQIYTYIVGHVVLSA